MFNLRTLSSVLSALLYFVPTSLGQTGPNCCHLRVCTKLTFLGFNETDLKLKRE